MAMYRIDGDQNDESPDVEVILETENIDGEQGAGSEDLTERFRAATLSRPPFILRIFALMTVFICFSAVFICIFLTTCAVVAFVITGARRKDIWARACRHARRIKHSLAIALAGFSGIFDPRLGLEFGLMYLMTRVDDARVKSWLSGVGDKADS